jgi:hypothetical protein
MQGSLHFITKVLPLTAHSEYQCWDGLSGLHVISQYTGYDVELKD